MTGGVVKLTEIPHSVEIDSTKMHYMQQLYFVFHLTVCFCQLKNIEANGAKCNQTFIQDLYSILKLFEDVSFPSVVRGTPTVV